MRVRGVMLALMAGGVMPAAGLAQRPITADSSRYALVLDSSPRVQAEQVARLWLASLAQSLQVADTLSLARSLDNVETAAGERSAAASRGCRSPGWAVAQLRRARGRQGLVPLGRLQIEVRSLDVGADGSVTVVARLTDVLSRPRQFAEFSVVFFRQRQALVATQASGMLAALCGMVLAG